MLSKIEELRSGGFTDTEIALMLQVPLSEVTKCIAVVEEPENVLINLKSKIHSTAMKAVGQIEKDLGGRPDAQELSKLTDSLSKLHTSFFKEDKNTTVNIMNNSLNMFKNSLKG